MEPEVPQTMTSEAEDVSREVQTNPGSLEVKLPGPKGNPNNVSQHTFGGPRAGGGRPKGSLNKTTKERKEAEQYFRDRVIRSKEALVNSQLSLAQGVQMLYVIKTVEENGKRLKQKPEIVTDQETITAYLAGEFEDSLDEYYFITTERPDNKALDSLFDRALGKAKTVVELDANVNSTNLSGDDFNPAELDAVKQALLAALPEVGGE